MTDDEIRALRSQIENMVPPEPVAEALALADEALRRGEEIARLEQNAIIRGAYVYARRVQGVTCSTCGYPDVFDNRYPCLADHLRADLAEAHALIRRVVAEVDPPMGAGRCITGPTIAALRAFRDRES